jgi:hypothetical protein
MSGKYQIAIRRNGPTSTTPTNNRREQKNSLSVIYILIVRLVTAQIVFVLPLSYYDNLLVALLKRPLRNLETCNGGPKGTDATRLEVDVTWWRVYDNAVEI